MSKRIGIVSADCKHCGDYFSHRHSVLFNADGSRKRMYCARVCADQAKKISVPTFECEQCKKTTFRKKSPGNGGYMYAQKFCSKVCASNSYRTGGHIHHTGYRYLGINGQVIPEHRYVMEQKIGRKLLSTETVHHINGQKLDNRPENLELWSSRHCKGQRVQDQVNWAIDTMKQYQEILANHGYELVERKDNVTQLEDAKRSILKIVS